MNIKQSIESGNSVRVDISPTIWAIASKPDENYYICHFDNKKVVGHFVDTPEELISAMEEVAPLHEWK